MHQFQAESIPILGIGGIVWNWNWNWLELVGIGIRIGRNWSRIVWNRLELVSKFKTNSRTIRVILNQIQSNSSQSLGNFNYLESIPEQFEPSRVNFRPIPVNSWAILAILSQFGTNSSQFQRDSSHLESISDQFQSIPTNSTPISHQFQPIPDQFKPIPIPTNSYNSKPRIGIGIGASIV